MGNRILVAVMVVSAACGKSKQQCQTEVADLVAYLKTLDLEAAAVPMTAAHLVSRTDLTERPSASAPVVDLLPAGVMFQGMTIEPTELPHKLREAVTDPRHRPGDDPNTVLFAVDEAVPWQRVADLVGLVSSEAAFDHIGFVFAQPATAVPPPHTTVDDEIAQLGTNPSDRAVGFAKILTGLIGSCKPMKKLFSEMASIEAGNKAEIFITGTGEALTACDCNIDLPKFRSAAYAILNVVSQRAIYVSTSRDQGAPLAIAPSTPWRDASKQITTHMILQVK